MPGLPGRNGLTGPQETAAGQEFQAKQERPDIQDQKALWEDKDHQENQESACARTWIQSCW